MMHALDHDLPEEPLAGLRGTEGLDRIEAIMLTLALGPRVDRLGVILHEHLLGGGGRLRARLALAAAEALGIERSAAVPWAAACETVHNATLVHDDLQDGDRLRRGSPAVWVRHGAPQAINAGDLLLMLPFRALEGLDVDDATRWRLARAIARRSEEAVRGQSLEMQLVPERRLDWSSWADSAEGKSGALLALPVEGAAILAGLGSSSVAPLASAFAALGVLYQAHDDVKDLWGDKGRERRGNDLREGKPSAVVVGHLSLYPGDAGDLVRVLETPREQTRDEVVEAWIARFDTGGARAWVRDRIGRLEARVLENPTLRAVPDLHAIASEVVASLRAEAS